MVIDPITAPIVRRLFDEAIAGRSYSDMREGLNREGVPPPTPKNNVDSRSETWSVNTIADLLHKRQYAGYVVWGLNSTSGDPPVIVRGLHEAIVSDEYFELAGRTLASKAPEVTHPRQTGSVYMMSQLLRCRQCGHNLIVRPSKNQSSRYYQCRTRRHDGAGVCNCPNLNIRRFEERFLQVVLDDILCPSNVQAAIARISEEVSGPSQEQHARLVTIDQELSDIRQRQARVMEPYEKGAYTVDDFGWRMTPLREAEADLREKRANSEKDLDEQTAMISDPRKVLEFVKEVSAFVRHSPPKDRKQMLRRFIKCVWIEPGWGTVEYRIPLPRDAKRPEATELVLALDEPVPPIARVAPVGQGSPARTDRTTPRLRRRLRLRPRLGRSGNHHAHSKEQLLQCKVGDKPDTGPQQTHRRDRRAGPRIIPVPR